MDHIHLPIFRPLKLRSIALSVDEKEGGKKISLEFDSGQTISTSYLLVQEEKLGEVLVGFFSYSSFQCAYDQPGVIRF
jgi:aerobic-type carbon monoxide dehydrogenase small subunit (CoxS/CutS family)